jgi:hypothetical protein
MNNSDFNDFKNWQNGDNNDENNPNDGPNGFFFMGPMNPQFKDLWNKINSGEDFTQSMRDYLNIDDILKQYGKIQNEPSKNLPSKRTPRKHPKTHTLSQEEYQKLIEIRGYLAITEQFAHVKALDKLLSQIVMVPFDPKNK